MRRSTPRRAREEHGSALMLVPAAVLVLLLLGAVAVDSAVVFLAQRDLADQTAAVANDIAGFSATDSSFYGGDGVVLSEEQARRYTALAFAPDVRPAGFVRWGARATVVATGTVEVDAWAEVQYVFTKALPGFDDGVVVRATSTATARG